MWSSATVWMGNRPALRYGLGGTIPLTQREVAASFGISRSYVSRLEKKALEKLGREFERTQK